MSESGCLGFLTTYAQSLNGNPVTPFDTVGRPHPIFFSGTNCSGSLWFPSTANFVPSLLSPIVVSNPVANPVSGTYIQSIYIPSFWQVGVSATTTDPIVYFPATPQPLPILLSDTSNVAPFGQVINRAVLLYPPGPNNTVIDDNAWQLSMCNNYSSTIVGSTFLSTYQQGSPECDTFMNGFCASVINLSCESGTTTAVTLPSNLIPCTCLVEENCLRDTFCEPGNTNPACASENASAFQAVIPVTCFGKNCSVEGYRYGRMQNQRCNLTLCEQIINIIGDNIVVKGGSTIWCGNRAIPVTSVTPTPTVTPLPAGTVVLPEWAWILIGACVLLLFVAIPVAIVVYRRYRKRHSLPTTNSLIT